MRVGILGAMGKMGRECIRVFEREGAKIAFLVDAVGTDGVYKSFGEVPKCLACDVVVDFSSPGALSELLEFCKMRKCAAVLATTGFSVGQMRLLRSAAGEIPLFVSRNMSIGVNILARLCGMLAKSLQGCECEIVEAHHSAKKDAPSGTALYLADILSEAMGGAKYVYDRHLNEQRKSGEIGIHSLRGGSVVGRHDVYFFMAGETLKLCHSAENRELFAVGALNAAKFIIQKEKGFFTMDDLVNEMLK